MLPWRAFVACLAVVLLPAAASAADDAHLELPVWSIAPFVVLLLAIAILPVLAGHWWHENWNKAIVSLALGIPIALYLAYMQFASGQPALSALGHEMGEYVAFILLLGSLYTVSGGIVVSGELEGKPLINMLFLASGAVLANLIGTTGASVLLIRPVLRINQQRQHTRHLPVFFIFTVSNLGGLLTPLGDPPLFLGYFHGVPFFWTLGLWREWLCANGVVLAVFFLWDTLAYRREELEAPTEPAVPARPRLRVHGLFNVPLLFGVIGAVLLQGWLVEPWGKIAGGAIMLGMAGLSWGVTPATLREVNAFNWDPILEVAILFLGIFVTMVPALAILGTHRELLHVTEPWQYFWLTGLLSAFLDNAPTYLTLATMATGSGDFLRLVQDEPAVLRAISCGAVFMGALTYIGNGPNFMVKAIADQAGYKTPSFLGYLAYSCAILGPVFVFITFLFFLSP